MASSAMTTGRLTMASMVTMPACPTGTIGWLMIEPSEPGLLTVKVAPCRSSRLSLPLRAFRTIVAEGAGDAGDAQLVGVAQDGDDQAVRRRETAMPRLYWRWRVMLVAGPGGVELGDGAQAGQDGLDEERQVGELVALAGLPLGLQGVAVARPRRVTSISTSDQASGISLRRASMCSAMARRIGVTRPASTALRLAASTAARASGATSGVRGGVTARGAGGGGSGWSGTGCDGARWPGRRWRARRLCA